MYMHMYVRVWVCEGEREKERFPVSSQVFLSGLNV